MDLPAVKLVHQVHNLAARQEREKGYCEVVLGGASCVSDMLLKAKEFAPEFCKKTGLALDDSILERIKSLVELAESF